MYVKSQQYKVFEPNKKIKKKFYNFLGICQDLLEYLDKNNIKYAAIIPYATKVEYDTDNSIYKNSITYVIINNVEPIKKGDIHNSPYVVFKQNTDTKDFVNEIKKALDLKDKQKGFILVSDYHLHEQLERELSQEIASKKVSIKSIYTSALYYHITNTLGKGEQVGESGLADVCGAVSSGSKGFSRRENKDSSNLMVCNTTAATIAGIRKNEAVATVDLDPELVEAINMAIGVPINGINVVLTNANHIIDTLRLLTHKSFSSRNEMQDTRHYSTNVQKRGRLDKEVEPYAKLIKKVAEIFFANTPDNLKDFLGLFNNMFDDFIYSLYNYYKSVAKNILKGIDTLLSNLKSNDDIEKHFYVLLAVSIGTFIRSVISNSQQSFNPPTDVCQALNTIRNAILNLSVIRDIPDNQEKDILTNTLEFTTFIFYVLVYYGASQRLMPIDTWDTYVKILEQMVTKMNKPSLDNAGTGGNGTISSIGAAGGQHPSPPKSPTTLHILKKKQFLDCHLYDRSSALNYCKILLNGDSDTDKHINSDPLKTILDIMEYLSGYSGGIFSNIDQIYKINETSIPHVPINFNKYDIENLMLLTCDQNLEAIPLLYRQACIDAEFVSNNVAVDIVNDQLKSQSYEFNIIIFKRRELKIDEKMIEALDNLVKDFGKKVQTKVEAMAFVKGGVDISQVLSKYSFTGNLILVNDDPLQSQENLNKTLSQHIQNCFNLVYMIDDHQYLHEMHIPFNEVEEYTDNNIHYDNVKIPLTSYLNYVLQYTLHYRDPNNQSNLPYRDVTGYRVLLNEMSIKKDFVRLLAYIHLLFDTPQLKDSADNNVILVKVIDTLENISQQAQVVRKISFSSKPYTISLEPIKKFIENVKNEEWYKKGFHRCNPNKKRILEEYYKLSASYYEKFLNSKQYNDHVHKIIGACQTPGKNVMSNDVGRVYVSVLKPYEFSEIRGRIPSGEFYFDELNRYIDTIANRIDGLYYLFSGKLKTHNTPEIDYNIEADVMNEAVIAKGTASVKDKLKLLDELDLGYVERIAYVTAARMILLMRSAPQGTYDIWAPALAPIVAQKDAPLLLTEHLPGLDYDTYRKALEFSKFFKLNSTEFILLILTSRYLAYFYSSKDQDISQTFRELIRNVITTTASEASVYRIQILIAGIRMFLQNFICDLYSNSRGRDFMDANKFSGSYLIICEDSDLAAALASSLSILLKFKGKTDKALKEIETLARQFYSNVFKTLYKNNNKWYKRIIRSIMGNKDKNIMIGEDRTYYDEELGIIDKTLDMIRRALDNAKSFITSSEEFDRDYPLYGLAALAFVLAIPMTLSLAMSLGDRDSTNSMQGLVYRYQDTMSAYGITLSSRYCSAGYGMRELDWPEDHKISQLIDFPVSTNIVKPENIFDRNNYNEAIITISEVLSHRAKTMQTRLGQVIVTDDHTRLSIDMNNFNTIIILSGRRSTLSQAKIQNTRILSEKVAWELYDQTNRKANVYYVAFEYDDRIQSIINDTYLKEDLKHGITYARLGLNQSINDLYSVMSQVQVVQSGTAGPSNTQQPPQFNPIVLTIAIT